MQKVARSGQVCLNRIYNEYNRYEPRAAYGLAMALFIYILCTQYIWVYIYYVYMFESDQKCRNTLALGRSGDVYY